MLSEHIDSIQNEVVAACQGHDLPTFRRSVDRALTRDDRRELGINFETLRELFASAAKHFQEYTLREGYAYVGLVSLEVRISRGVRNCHFVLQASCQDGAKVVYLKRSFRIGGEAIGREITEKKF